MQQAESYSISKFTGDNTDRIRPMELVEKCRLMAGQTFVSKEIVWMHIAEEANRHRINIKMELSRRIYAR